MGEKSSIEWCDSTLNVQMGCDGCELANPKRPENSTCYAHGLSVRHVGHKGYPADFFKPELFVERLDAAIRWKDLTGTERPDKPWLDGMPRVIFLDDMGDTFTESLDPRVWLAPLLPKIAASPHLYLCLTKRPNAQRLFAQDFPLPWNWWAGASITGPQWSRMSALRETAAKMRFLSFEPMLEPANLRFELEGIGLVIFGGESGPGARKGKPGWLEPCITDCREQGAAVFVKQGFGHLRSGDWSDLPPEYRIREFPK